MSETTPLGSNPVGRVCRTWSDAVSMTETVSDQAFVTIELMAIRRDGDSAGHVADGDVRR